MSVDNLDGLLRMLKEVPEPIRKVTISTTHGRSMEICIRENDGAGFVITDASQVHAPSAS